jgi:hypothetical protein
MTKTRPRVLDVRRSRHLLARAKAHRTVPARVEVLSASLLGCGYQAHGLVGSAGTPEAIVAPLDRFDCVTYVETVLALARSGGTEAVLEELRRIRYDGGRVEWARRNHYMTDWIRRNARGGVVRPVRGGEFATRKERILRAVEGLPPKRARFSCVPKSKLAKLGPRLRNGDVILFASTREDLDVFHCGFLVRASDRWRLRHASRSSGRVVEEDLATFLGRNRMAGLIVVRPVGDSVEVGS